MPHHAKHHASENRRAIERSLVTRTKNVSSLAEGRLWSRLLMLPIPTVYDAHILRTSLSPCKCPCKQGHLHGVSHHIASPMPTLAFVPVSPHRFSLNHVMGIKLCEEIDVGNEKLGEIGFKQILIGVPVRTLAPSGFTEAETIVLTSLTS